MPTGHVLGFNVKSVENYILYKEKYDIYIGRAGKGQNGYFGNPFSLGRDGDRAEVIKKYESWFYNQLSIDDEFKERIIQLKNKTLGCFCKPQPCHGDVICNYLNNLEQQSG